MRIRTFREIATASFIAAGLAVWPGCGSENAGGGGESTIGKIEKEAAVIEHKVEAGAEKAEKVIKEDAIKAADATGKAMEKAGEKLETAGKEAAEKHLGKKAGEVVEKAGKALEKGGQKVEDAAEKKN